MTPVALGLPPFWSLPALSRAAIGTWVFALGFADGYMLARMFG